MKHHIKKIKLCIVTLILCFTFSSSLSALTIRIGSIAPDGSPWDIALKKMGKEWKRISGGKIKVKIYPGGIVGSEPDMIRKIRIGQLQGAIFTGVGMSKISPQIISLSLPLLVHSDKELDYLLKKNAPTFEGLIEKKGFKVLTWSKAGWVHFFSNKKVVYPKDLKKLKLSVGVGDAKMLQAWRAIGFQAVPLSTKDVMTGLQSGMVDAFYAPPLVAAAFQWFGLAKNMCKIKVAPVIGGVVISKKTWRKIPNDIKPQLLASARKISKGLYRKSIKLEKRAMRTMKKHGLKVRHVPRKARRKWQKEAAKCYNVFVGKTFSRKLFLKLKKDLREYRRR
ncbi:MAG: ABC transporter substrate-binding protein [bacterium]|nr:ABC transporter substrate-binding protein [bacterium]